MAGNPGSANVPMPMAGPLEAPPGQGFLGATLGIAGKHAAYAFEKPGGLRDQLSYMVGYNNDKLEGQAQNFTGEIKNASEDIVDRFFGDDLKDESMMDKYIALSGKNKPVFRGDI